MANIERLRGSRSIWDPVREFSSLQRSIDRLFEDVLSPITSTFEREQREIVSQPKVDAEETETHYLLSIDLPGIRKDDVKIELRDNQLIVSGERREERSEGKEKGSRYIQERYYGQFQRIFTLPTNVDPEKVEANYENGVLCLAIPKSEVSKPKVIPIGERKGGFFERLLSSRKEEKEGREKEKSA